MKINIMSIDDVSSACDAWRLSRDVSRVVQPDEIAHVDVPVNEMPSALIHFQDFTIMEREIFASPRNHVMWARTSHVDDAADFQVPDEFYWLEPDLFDDRRNEMRQKKVRGISQDEYRFQMPVLATTSWVQRMSFRDAVKMHKYLTYLLPKVDATVSLRLARASDELRIVVDEFCRGDRQVADKALQSMLPVKYLHEGNVRLGIAVESDEFISIPMKQPLWMRAQIARHRSLGLRDDFFLKVLTSPDYIHCTLDTAINLAICADKDFWRSILGKRTCWLAQDTLEKKKDLWQEIIDSFGFREDMLPCSGGWCPYEGDAALRLTDADPGAPCPRYININGIAAGNWRSDMIKAAASRHPFWLKEIG